MESILVVDDSKTQLFSIALLLKKEGYRIDTFSDPFEAKAALERTSYDLFLCDLQMPGLNGLAFLKLSKALHPQMPFVIMTAYGDRESAIEALSMGAEDYIFKATGHREEEEFLIRVRRAIEKARLQMSILKYQEQLEQMVMDRTRALQEAQEQLIQSEKLRSLGIMTNGIAHDFNNILGVILGRTQLLMRKTVDGGILDDLRIIEKASLKGSSTIRRMQDYTRIRRDESFIPVQINEVIEEVVEITKTRWKDEAHERGLLINIKKEYGDVPLINGNSSELKDVFINVIFNAIDAMPGGGTIAIRTRREDIMNDSWVVVDVTDTGVGIVPEIQPKIFEPFFTTKSSEGSGLGMSVAYGIIQRHKGHISFSSTVARGTTFVIRFPAALFLQEISSPSVQPPIVPGTEKKSVLVIDDDDSMRTMLTEILEIDHHEVASAASGREALALLQRRPYQIVFTDLGMPEMSGWDLAQEIKRRLPQTRIIMITGWGTQLDKEKAVESGIERILPKPVTCDEILRAVSE